jgi:IclR family acetate operon transcriptional repressor
MVAAPRYRVTPEQAELLAAATVAAAREVSQRLGAAPAARRAGRASLEVR